MKISGNLRLLDFALICAPTKACCSVWREMQLSWRKDKNQNDICEFIGTTGLKNQQDLLATGMSLSFFLPTILRSSANRNDAVLDRWLP